MIQSKDQGIMNYFCLLCHQNMETDLVGFEDVNNKNR